MLINRKSLRDGRIPILLSLVLLVAADVTYRLYALNSIHGPSGGSILGLAYGAAGTLMIAFAMLLMMRKTWRTLRVGSAYQWLQWHVWIALISYPIIGYHAGWRWGGPLTTLLMSVFTIVWVTGIVGLLLQNLVPLLMRDLTPSETVYEQIDRVDRENLKRARYLVRARRKALADVGGDEADATSASGGDADPGESLQHFYETEVRPYLAHALRPAPASWWMPWPASAKNWLILAPGNPPAAPPARAFARMRSRHPGLFEELNALESFVEQRRQHRLQKRLHWVMHGWLLLHVPLSFILINLIPLHAVWALRY